MTEAEKKRVARLKTLVLMYDRNSKIVKSLKEQIAVLNTKK